MRAIAMMAFLGSTAMTGAATAAALLWASGATLGLIGVAGWTLMTLTAIPAFGAWDLLDQRMQESRAAYGVAHLTLSPSRRDGLRRSWPQTAREARR